MIRRLMPLGLLLFAAVSIAANAPQCEELHGAYEVISLPTPEEQARLEHLAVSSGVDLDGALKELPEDANGWKKILALSLRFNRFDRRAEIYGYRLFTAFSYFIDGAGEARFAEIVDAQPPQVQQRVRDFLYYEAINPDPVLTVSNERVLRTKLELVFPSRYSFAAGDSIFTPIRDRLKSKETCLSASAETTK